jgi:hypothetical protein
LLLLLHHLTLLLLLHASHQLLLELLLQLLLHVHADSVGVRVLLLLILVFIVLVRMLSPLFPVLFIDLSDVRAASVDVIVAPLGVHVLHGFMLHCLFLVIVLIIAHVFFVLVLLDGLSPDHVVVVHDHHVVIALVVIFLLFTIFLILIVLVIIHILLLVHLLVLVLLKEKLLLLVLLERGLRGEVAWEVGSCHVQAIVVLGTQQ